LGETSYLRNFWEILGNFGALAVEFQNLVVRALQHRAADSIPGRRAILTFFAAALR
jgi:hypothetical protein